MRKIATRPTGAHALAALGLWSRARSPHCTRLENERSEGRRERERENASSGQRTRRAKEGEKTKKKLSLSRSLWLYLYPHLYLYLGCLAGFPRPRIDTTRPSPRRSFHSLDLFSPVVRYSCTTTRVAFFAAPAVLTRLPRVNPGPASTGSTTRGHCLRSDRPGIDRRSMPDGRRSPGAASFET